MPEIIAIPGIFIPLIKTEAANKRLNPVLVAAIIWQESRFKPEAKRREPNYPYLWDVRGARRFRTLTPTERASALPPKDFLGSVSKQVSDEWMAVSEWLDQRTSFGLGQIMGATARWLGYNGELTDLFVPEINVGTLTKYLAKLVEKYGLEGAISAYNAGQPFSGNQNNYVLPVLTHMKEIGVQGIFSA